MPTITGSKTTYITRSTVVDYCNEQDDRAEAAEFARWVSELGVSYIISAIIKKHPVVVASTVKGLLDFASFVEEAENAMTAERDELDSAVRRLAANTNPNAKIKVITTYSEWQSGSGNHSCNYQVKNSYNVV